MKASKFALSFLIGSLWLVGQTAQAQMSAYNIVDLGSLDGGSSVAYGINNQGQVCGAASYTITLPYTATIVLPVIFSNGHVKSLGNLATQDIPPDQNVGQANSINDKGEAVGVAANDPGKGTAFLYSNGVLQQTFHSTQNAINNAGERVGGGDNTHAYLYSSGGYTDMGTLGGVSSLAFGLNNVGQVVGYSDTVNGVPGHPTAFLYQNGQMQDIGKDTGLVDSLARSINDNGQVVGVGYLDSSDNVSRGFLWQNGQTKLLGTLGGQSSAATAVNKNGIVVGYSDVTRNLVDPFVYQNGQMIDLFAGTGWTYGYATAINDSGQIVGYGYHNGVTRAFLATPRATPAPGSMVAAVGVGLLIGRLRQRRS